MEQTGIETGPVPTTKPAKSNGLKDFFETYLMKPNPKDLFAAFVKEDFKCNVIWDGDMPMVRTDAGDENWNIAYQTFCGGYLMAKEFIKQVPWVS